MKAMEEKSRFCFSFLFFFARERTPAQTGLRKEEDLKRPGKVRLQLVSGVRGVAGGIIKISHPSPLFSRFTLFSSVCFPFSLGSSLPVAKRAIGGFWYLTTTPAQPSNSEERACLIPKNIHKKSPEFHVHGHMDHKLIPEPVNMAWGLECLLGWTQVNVQPLKGWGGQAGKPNNWGRLPALPRLCKPRASRRSVFSPREIKRLSPKERGISS